MKASKRISPVFFLVPAFLLMGSLAACVEEGRYPSYPDRPYQEIRVDYNTRRPGSDYSHFRTRDFASCKDACRNDPRCRAMDFEVTSNTCWLKDSVPPARPSRTIASGVKEGGYNQGGSDQGGGYYPPVQSDEIIAGLQITRNIKRNGGDYTSFRVRNVRECARACAGDSRCRSFNYSKQQRDCWLKDTVPAGVSDRRMISGYRHGDGSGGGYQPYPPDNGYPGQQPENIAGLQITRNVFRNGGDYTNFTVRNVRECARACAGDSRCRSFNYGKQRRDCWLKNNIPAGARDARVISGFKPY